MKIKQTIIAFVALMGLGGMFLAPLTASAATCGGVTTSILSCPKQTGGGDGVCPDGAVISKDNIAKGSKCTDGSAPDVTANSGVWGLLLLVINILTAGIGIAAIAGIIYGSILYSAAGDSADKVSKAREVIRNVVIGIIAYALMYAGLNFIIPGGLFTA